MLEELKILLGDAVGNFSEAQLGLALKRAIAEVENYCKRDLDYELECIAVDIAKLKLLRLNTEGLSNQSFSGVSETYIDGYPADIQKALNRKRQIRMV